MIELTVIAVAELVVICVLLYLRDRERTANAEILSDFSQRAEHERLQLVNHIKAPAYLTPTGGGAPRPQSEPHPNLAKVGTFAPRGGEE